MTEEKYQELLSLSDKYFKQGNYPQFLVSYAKCYEYDQTTFDLPEYIFKFSVANYNSSNPETLNEFNRYISHLETYLDKMPHSEQVKFINKLINVIATKFDENLKPGQIVTHYSFNRASIIITQIEKLLDYIIVHYESSDVIDTLTIIEEVSNKMLDTLRQIYRFRYNAHFIFRPIRPKKFIKQTKSSISSKILTYKETK